MSLALGKDINGNITFALDKGVAYQSGALAANTPVTLTVPNILRNPAGGKSIQAFFSFDVGTNVWWALDLTGTIAIPTTGVTTEIELNPGIRFVTAGSTIQLICGVASHYNIVYRQGQ